MSELCARSVGPSYSCAVMVSVRVTRHVERTLASHDFQFSLFSLSRTLASRRGRLSRYSVGGGGVPSPGDGGGGGGFDLAALALLTAAAC